MKCLYLIIDKQNCTEADKDPIEIAQIAFSLSLNYGIKYIQLRDKISSTSEFLNLALEIKKIQNNSKTHLIINDNYTVCEMIQADGIHLGANDAQYTLIKSQHPNWIVGRTINSLLELKKLNNTVLPDYIGVGPIYSTPIKPNKSPIGTQGLYKITQQTNLPIIAIGGINLNNLIQLKYLNISGIAMINHITQSLNLKQTLINTYNKLNEIRM